MLCSEGTSSLSQKSLYTEWYNTVTVSTACISIVLCPKSAICYIGIDRNDGTVGQTASKVLLYGQLLRIFEQCKPTCTDPTRSTLMKM